MKKLNDILLESCAFMNDYATANCKKDYVDEDDCCEWYHSAWQYLRVLDCVSSPQWHEDFYMSAFKSVFSKTDKTKILISGTADYSLLHILLCALAETGSAAEIDILDKCPTPPAICKWYFGDETYPGKIGDLFDRKKAEALKKSVTIRTVLKDLMYYNVSDGEKYDMICTDAFLTRFEKDSAVSVVKKWIDLMKPTGKVVTTVRVHEDAPAVTTYGIAKDVNIFNDKVKARYDRLIKDGKELKILSNGESVPLSYNDLSFLAYRYIVRMRSYSLGAVDEIANLFLSNGLKIDGKLSGIKKVDGEIVETKYYQIVTE